MSKILAVSVFAASCLLAACDKNDVNNNVTFEPQSLATCEKMSEVVVKWDLRSAYPDLKVVQIFVTEGGPEVLFAEGDAFGEVKTGLWVRPGIPRFVLKDKANGKVVGQGIVSGPKCQ